MAYQSGAAVDIHALMGAIRSFAVAQGFSVLAEDTYTLTFTNSTSSGARSHQTNHSLVSSLAGTGAYNHQGEASVLAARTVLALNGAVYQFFAYHKQMYKNGVLGSYACLEVWVCDDFDAGVAAHQQTHNRKYAILCPLSASLYGYHLFSSGAHVHLVLEETPGRFRHLSFGFLTQYSPFAGGQYVSAGCPVERTTTPAYGFTYGDQQVPFGANDNTSTKSNMLANAYAGTYVRADLEGLSPGWRMLTKQSARFDASHGDVWGCASHTNSSDSRAGSAAGTSSQTLAHDIAYNCAPQSWNGMAPLFPCYAGVFASPWNGNWMLLGEFPEVRFLNMANFNPGDELLLGTDVWKIFPLWNKAYTQQEEPISWDYGLAYRKVL